MVEEMDIRIKTPEVGRTGWGEFTHKPNMPWGPFHLTREPKVLFRAGDVEVLECFAKEYVEGDDGIVASGTLGHDPCLRYFLVGRRMDGKVVWWHNLVAEYDLENKKFVEDSITLEGEQLVVKGYEGCGNKKGKAISINVETGEKSVI